MGGRCGGRGMGRGQDFGSERTAGATPPSALPEDDKTTLEQREKSLQEQLKRVQTRIRNLDRGKAGQREK
jgi:hypothetical protein